MHYYIFGSFNFPVYVFLSVIGGSLEMFTLFLMLVEKNLMLFHANGKLMKLCCFKQLILTIFYHCCSCHSALW